MAELDDDMDSTPLHYPAWLTRWHGLHDVFNGTALSEQEIAARAAHQKSLNRKLVEAVFYDDVATGQLMISEGAMADARLIGRVRELGWTEWETLLLTTMPPPPAAEAPPADAAAGAPQPLTVEPVTPPPPVPDTPKAPPRPTSEKLQLKLMDAVEGRNLGRINKYIGKGAVPTPDIVTRATYDGDAAVMQRLLDAGAVPSPEDLHYAVTSRNTEMMNAMLASGTVVPARKSLTWAIGNLTTNAALALLRAGVPADADNLHQAVAGGNVNLVDAILANGVIPRAETAVLAGQHISVFLQEEMEDIIATAASSAAPGAARAREPASAAAEAHSIDTEIIAYETLPPKNLSNDDGKTAEGDALAAKVDRLKQTAAAYVNQTLMPPDPILSDEPRQQPAAEGEKEKILRSAPILNKKGLAP